MQKGYFYNVLHVQYSFCFLWQSTYRCFCNHFYKAKTKRHVTQRMSVSVLVESLEFSWNLHPRPKQILKQFVFLLKLKTSASRNYISTNKQKTHNLWKFAPENWTVTTVCLKNMASKKHIINKTYIITFAK